MVITQLTNRKEAEAFIASLRSISTDKPTERSYAGHLLFLATNLEISIASMILSNLRHFDIASGPYIACHLFVDRIEAEAEVRLLDLRRTSQDPAKHAFSLKQFEALTKHGRLNHIQLEDIQSDDLTAPTHYVARALGVVNSLPCLVFIEAAELAASDSICIIPFPNTAPELSRILNTLVGYITSPDTRLRELGEKLEHIHDLFDERASLRRQRGAPLGRKLPILRRVLEALLIDTELGLRDLKRARSVIGDSLVITPSELEAMDAMRKLEQHVTEGQSGARLELELQAHEHLLKSAFGKVFYELLAKTCNEKPLQSAEARSLALEHLLSKYEEQHSQLETRIASIENSIAQEKSALTVSESITELLVRDARKQRWRATKEKLTSKGLEALKAILGVLPRVSV